jgi:hypothetical protein
MRVKAICDFLMVVLHINGINHTYSTFMVNIIPGPLIGKHIHIPIDQVGCVMSLVCMNVSSTAVRVIIMPEPAACDPLSESIDIGFERSGKNEVEVLILGF